MNFRFLQLLLLSIFAFYVILINPIIQKVYASNEFITLSSFSGHQGSTVKLTGGNFSHNSMLDIYYENNKIQSINSNLSGAFSLNIIIPDKAKPGNLNITVKNNSNLLEKASNNFYATSYNSSINKISESNLPLSKLLLSGSGYKPNEEVEIKFANYSTKHSTDSNGSFTNVSISVPNVKPDTYKIIVTGIDSSSMATDYFYISGFYPSVSPTSYYITPGDKFNFNGNGFAPFENIIIIDNLSNKEVGNIITDSLGAFKNSGNVTSFYYYSGSTRDFDFKGSKSQTKVTTSTSFSKFYPQVTLTRYNVKANDLLNFNGNNFAPNGPVQIYLNKKFVGVALTDTYGNFYNKGNVIIPYDFIGQNIIYTLIGYKSTAKASVSISVDRYYPTISPSSYYIKAGENLSFKGSGFYPSEKIIVEDNTSTFETLTVNEQGNLIDNTIQIPFNSKHNLDLLITGTISKTPIKQPISIAPFDPNISLDNYYISSGQILNVRGSVFASNEDLILKAGSATVLGKSNAFGKTIMSLSIMLPFQKEKTYLYPKLVLSHSLAPR